MLNEWMNLTFNVSSRYETLCKTTWHITTFNKKLLCGAPVKLPGLLRPEAQDLAEGSGRALISPVQLSLIHISEPTRPY